MLSWAGLDERNALDTKVNRWSAGMQRKLLFIQAMLHKPEALILDEPTANLDPVARRELIDLLKRAVGGDLDGGWRTTVLISSHDLPEVQEISTMIGFLSHGELIAEDTQESLRSALSRAANTGATTFVVSGTNLAKIVNEIRDRLDATVSTTPHGKLTVTTKHANGFFNAVASVVANHPDVTIIDMSQEEEDLESIFLKLEKLTRSREDSGEDELKKKPKIKRG
jgi:ABC-2 type transport system ATP-binding protein